MPSRTWCCATDRSRSQHQQNSGGRNAGRSKRRSDMSNDEIVRDSRTFVIGNVVHRHDALFEVNRIRHVVVEVLPNGFVKLDPPSTGLSYWSIDCLALEDQTPECQQCRGTGRICCVCRSSEEDCQCPSFAEGGDCPWCGSGGRPTRDVGGDERPCSVCGNEERTAAGYLTCECPDSPHPTQRNGFPCRCANCVAIRERKSASR